MCILFGEVLMFHVACFFCKTVIPVKQLLSHVNCNTYVQLFFLLRVLLSFSMTLYKLLVETCYFHFHTTESCLPWCYAGLKLQVTSGNMQSYIECYVYNYSLSSTNYFVELLIVIPKMSYIVT